MNRLIAILALSIVASACQSSAPAVVASPSPSPSPHTLPTDAVLQPSDVPAGLNACSSSGPIDVYITTLAQSDSNLAAQVGTQWTQLRAAGATSGAISLFTSSPAACTAELGATSSAKSMASFVAVFGDAGEADRAWGSGIFGFAPPAPGELPAGITRGTATGLGLSSWTYDRSPLELACWHKSVFVALLVTTNLDPATLKAAATAIDARLD